MVNLSEYQERARSTDINTYDESDLRRELIPLLGLVDEAASIVTEYKKYLVDGDHYRIFLPRLKEEVGDMLWYLADFSSKVGVSLEEAAKYNLAKTASRFGQSGRPVEPLDVEYPQHERLPEEFQITLQIVGDGKTIMIFEGDTLGDPLSNNAYVDDGYKFHDVFHWAYVAHLGWSPVIRRMLKRKRKSVPKVDEVEDGARAAAIEEAVSALAFSSAVNYDFFQGCTTVENRLLRSVQEVTSHLEVQRRSASQWEAAILSGFEVWREINKSNGGTFKGSLSGQTFEFVGPAP